MKLKVVIIDDEELARMLIKNFLKNYPNIEIVGEGTNGFEGMKLIQEQKPDLVFLDVQMPKLTGFEMLELMDDYPAIIFTTAYDQYAIKAFEINAIDYLLKPFSRERFDAALKRIWDKETFEDTKLKANSLTSLDPGPADNLTRIVIKTGHKIKVIPVEEIHYLEAQDDFVMIYTKEGKFLKGKTMKYYENHLNSDDFIRVHRSYIVKADQILHIEPYEKESHIIVLHCGSKVPVSKSGYGRLREILKF